jgi:type III secretory pathway component EscU
MSKLEHELENLDNENAFFFLLKWGIVIVVFTFIILLCIYAYHFRLPLGTQSDFGAFGDFIGGTINPLLTFLSVMALIVTLRLQIAELRYTKNELKEALKERKEANNIAKNAESLHEERAHAEYARNCLRDVQSILAQQSEISVELFHRNVLRTVTVRNVIQQHRQFSKHVIKADESGAILIMSIFSYAQQVEVMHAIIDYIKEHDISEINYIARFRYLKEQFREVYICAKYFKTVLEADRDNVNYDAHISLFNVVIDSISKLLQARVKSI